MGKNNTKHNFIEIKSNLLRWYSIHQRKLPWRTVKNPYFIWVSEIMLQQTQVISVIDYYKAFLDRYPTIESLAKDNHDGVLQYWRGLGYYSRALNLHFAAKQVVDDYNSEFPSTYTNILKLKGIGKYTAAAIASICFNEAILAIDGNLYRVLSRFFADDFDISKSSAFSYFSELGKDFLDENHTGDINQAFMDLGATICKPKNPNCMFCPLRINCQANINNTQNNFPIKTNKVKIRDLELNYYLIHHQNLFLIKKRSLENYWKNLHEISTENLGYQPYNSKVIFHRLTHIRMKITFSTIEVANRNEFNDLATENKFQILNYQNFYDKTFPKPIQDFISNFFENIKN